MEILIKGEAKEIAALAAELQGRAVSVDAVAQELAERLSAAVSCARIP